MDPAYDIGFVPSMPINGGHWYSDPFNLYTDYGISRISEPYMQQSYPLAIYSIGTFAYINNTEPTPVPEQSTMSILIIGLIGTFLLKKYKLI